jgi:hypothetical protein
MALKQDKAAHVIMELTIMRGVHLLRTAEIVQSLVIPWSEFGCETTRVNPKPLG